MADNIVVKDANAVSVTVRSTDNAGVQTPHHNISDGGNATQGAMADVAATTDTGTFSLIALIKRLLTKFGGGFDSRISLTRTNDTNAYTGGDVIGSATSAAGAVWTFTTIGAASGDIIITDASLEIDVTSIPSGMTSFRLHLYNVTPPSALGDNAAWDLPSGDRTAYLGYIDLGTPVDVGSTLYVQNSGINKKVRMPAGTSLFGYLVTNGGYTPTAQVVKVIDLGAVAV